MRVATLVGLFVLCALSLYPVTATGVTDPAARKQVPPVETILEKWAAAMHVDRPRAVHFQRIVHDRVFHREERGTGSFALDRAGHGRCLLAPGSIDGQAKTRDRDGVKYELEPSSPTKWYWTNTSIYQLDSSDMTAAKLDRNRLGWLATVLQDPQRSFPLMLGFDASDLTGPLDWQIKDDWKRADTQFYLTAKPRRTDIRYAFCRWPWHANFSRIDVLIDRQSYETIGLRFVNMAGSRQTVYAIEQITDIEGDFWQPDLTGYKVRTSPSDSDIVNESTPD